MKLLFFTPCYKKSAIGRSTALITNALLKHGHTIAICQTEANFKLNDEMHDFGCKPIPWTNNENIQELIEEGYHCIYIVGDNYLYHKGAIYWLALQRGTVCLHDFYLGNLFAGWESENPKKAMPIFMDLYGAELAANSFISDAANHAPQLLAPPPHETSPMTEWICAQASGVLTHSLWGIDRVLSSCPGPVAICGLAYDFINTSISKPNLHEKKEAFVLLVMGYVNPNKRLKSLIQAIGEDPLLKELVELRSVGPVSLKTRRELLDLANDNQVQLMIFGEVPDQKLRHELQETSALSCLRYPPLEAASASLIEGLLSKKSILVTDRGCYSEIPDGLVYKVDPTNEIEDIQKHLHFLISEPVLASQATTKAFEWAKDVFSEENYATELASLIKKSRAALPMIEALNSLSATLLTWEPKLAPYLNQDLFPNLEIFEDRN